MQRNEKLFVLLVGFVKKKKPILFVKNTPQSLGQYKKNREIIPPFIIFSQTSVHFSIEHRPELKLFIFI